MLPDRLCDSSLTLVVPSGPLLVVDKHNWSREVTYGPLDCSWSHEISSSRPGRSQQSLLDCWAIAGFHREPWAIAVCSLGTWAIAGFTPGSLGDRRLAPGDLSDRRIPPGLLSGRPLCSVVAPFASWSPPMQSGRPLRSLVAPFAIPLPEECL